MFVQTQQRGHLTLLSTEWGAVPLPRDDSQAEQEKDAPGTISQGAVVVVDLGSAMLSRSSWGTTYLGCYNTLLRVRALHIKK